MADRVDGDLGAGARCAARARRSRRGAGPTGPWPASRAGRRRPDPARRRAAALHSSVPHPHDDAVMKTWDDARRHLVLMLALTFTTGIVDAVGYLGLDRVFTANMTGNVVILGMALAGADDLPVLGPALALVGFLAGAALGGRVLRTAPAGWSHRTSVHVRGDRGARGRARGARPRRAARAGPRSGRSSSPALLAVAMGLQAATARRLAVKDVTTVVVTSTLTGPRRRLAARRRHGDGWARRSLAVGADPGRRRGRGAAAARRRRARGGRRDAGRGRAGAAWRRVSGTGTARPERSGTGDLRQEDRRSRGR